VANVVAIKLTAAQVSALTCAGLLDDVWRDGDLTPEEEILRLSIQETRTGFTLVVSANTRDTVAAALNDLSNAEDEASRGQANECAILTRRASRVLANLYGKVLRTEVARG
jgi:hypothetical protein